MYLNKYKNLSKHGFTLAEVLITLGIIGVVAAMTIPTLINNTQEKEFTEGLKKFYSDVSGAVSKINMDGTYDIVNATTTASTPIIRNALCDFLSCVEKGTVIEIFGTSLSHVDSVNNTVYKNYKSTASIYCDVGTTQDGAAKLKNGMFFAVHNFWPIRKSFQLYVDTNGTKGPNMFGKDLNMFEVVRDDSSGNFKVVVEGAVGSYSYNEGHKSCQAGITGTHAGVWACSYYRFYQPESMP